MNSQQWALYAYEIASALQKRYKDFSHYNRKNPLEELVFIILSSKTDEAKYRATFRALRERFPSFRQLAEATLEEIAHTIAPGGLSNQKAETIKEALDEIIKRFGRPTLSPLKMTTDEECERFLITLPRIGKKTARCVMMYSLDRKVFPVDTHCWRIAQRLGWIKPSYTDERYTQADMDRLQEIIPPDLRYSLHVNFVSLGREICTASKPKCSECPIRLFCPKIGVRDAP